MTAEILALLPAILGGFLFIRFFYFTRFYISRTQGQRLFFYSASLGLGFALVANLWINAELFPIPHLRSTWQSMNLPSGTSTVISPFVLSLSALLFLNFVTYVVRRFSGSKDQTTNWVDLKLAESGRIGNEIESFLLLSAHQGRQIMVTLEDRKLYVGLLTSVINRPLESDSWLSIFPDKSGFRQSETKEVTFTTDYAPFTYHNMLQWKKSFEAKMNDLPLEERSNSIVADIVSTLEKEIAQLQESHASLGEDFSPHDWVKYIPTSQIVSIGPYDIDSQLFKEIDNGGSE